ncbi:MAG: polyamine aminopropyltransferase [Pseudomonadota bacterium]|jgi:spermidine synthase
MSDWYTEKHTPRSGITIEVKERIYHARSEFQTVEIVDTFEFGRMLLLDGLVMLTERDEFVYHEMLAHVPLNSHPDPRRVLVIGGGDGGTVREVLKHPEVREVTLVEIDQVVVEAALTYLPGISGGLRDERTRVIYGDGVRFVSESPVDSYDVVLVDSTDPVGPAEALFTEDFFRACTAAMTAGGVIATQSESPFYHLPFMTQLYRRMKGVIPKAAFYLAPVPTYPSGYWSFLMGSGDPDMNFPQCREHVELTTGFYSREIHLASFAVPKFLAEALSS